jgi:hypothetical protein
MSSRTKSFRRVDDRHRISLNGVSEHEYYEISKDGDRIILTPVVVVPAYLAKQLREAAGSGALGR